jgi:hypothetical protein
MPADLDLAGPRQSSPESPAADLAAMRIVSLPEHWPPLADDQPPGRAAGREPGGPADPGQALARQFAMLLAEGLSGVRPVRQLMPWMSSRGSAQLRRLLPLFTDGHRLRVLRVLTASPAPDVIEMTLVVASGPRTRALAIRLERTVTSDKTGKQRNGTARREKLATPWRCTDIEG